MLVLEVFRAHVGLYRRVIEALYKVRLCRGKEKNMEITTGPSK